MKTRLAATLGLERAARLHAAFVEDVVATLAEGPFDLRLAWALDDGEAPPTDPAVGVPALRQRGADLGERMFHALEEATAEVPFAAIVGSDHPEIDPIQVDDAFRRLEAGADVALGPVPDGGYFLIATRREALHRRLFDDIAWSTDQVFATTAARCRELGLHLSTLPQGHDIDDGDDLQALIGRLERRPTRCPATRAVLESWDMLRPIGASTFAEVVRRP